MRPNHLLSIAAAVVAAAVLAAACGDSDEATTSSAVSCDNYCSTINTACTGTPNAQYGFIDLTDCLTYCNAVGWTAGTQGQTGNTLACRVDHAVNASVSAAQATIHCPHAGPTGGTVCGGYCESYCELALEACTGANQIFASAGECTTACNTLAANNVPPGSDGNLKTGNSLQCRIWHLAVARVSNPQIHCFHGRPDSIQPGGAPGSGPCN
jgi:hypothetical protein